MSGKTASLIGGTGLIGGELLKLLLDDPAYSTVKLLVRRPVALEHPKLEKRLVDFNDGDSLLIALANSDVTFCTVGTTQKKVKGDRAAYRKVDYDIPVNAARFCRMTGCKTFVLVSAVGANSKSSNFYLRFKGEVEETVRGIGIEAVHIMRPSWLLGNRKEFRPMEKFGLPVLRLLSSLLPSKYKAIEAKDVARAMLVTSKLGVPGYFVYEYEGMEKVIGQ
jgi:uncharacterized protein YbjT (DUF2867 family)